MAEACKREGQYRFGHSIFYLLMLAACNIVVASLVWNILPLMFSYVAGPG